MDPDTVGKWRRRFVEHRLEGLRDEPRSGTPRTIEDTRIQPGRTLFCAHHRAQDQARHLSQCGGATGRDCLLHRASQRRANAVPMDRISR
nr:helix-turn-helix domain-containing protein [Bradyrhizobium brasilense]